MKAIISGAGIAGLATAVELGRRGWSVLVVERAPQLRAGGYMIDFFGPGYDAAEEMSILGVLKERAYDVGGVELVNPDGSRQALMSYDLLRKSLEGRVFSLLRGDIEHVLHGALPESVELRFGTTIANIGSVEGLAEVTLSDGTQAAADLLIGADGIHSHVRSMLFGPEEDFVTDLGFRTAAYVFRSDAIARAVGDRFVMISVPDRQVGIYGLRDGGVTAFLIWRDDAALSDVPGQLNAEFGDLGWIVPEVLAGVPDDHMLYADIAGQVTMPTWHKGRALLIGDAAFAVSLLAGQGASMAIGGAHALGRALDEHADLDEALAAYEALVRPEVEKKQAAGRRTAKWFVPPTVFHVWLRAIVFNLTSIPLLSRVVESFVASSPKGVFSARG